MSRSRRMRGVLALMALLGVAATVVGAGLWLGTSYVGLVRRQVAIADACERVEATSRQREALVANLLVGQRAAGRSGDELRALEAALADVQSRHLGSQRIAGEARRYRDYVEAQGRLGHALSAVLSGARAGDPSPSREAWRGAETQLDRSLVRLETTREELAVAVRRFPGSVLAGLVGLRPAQATPGAPAATPGSVPGRRGRRG